MNKFIRFLLDKEFRFRILVNRNLVPWMSDEKVISKMYVNKFKRPLNLSNPTTFNEKMQWLKLYYRKKEFSNMVDKYEAKILVEKKIGSEYVIPLYGVWNKFEDINFDELPNSFVLKATHDCGSVVVCKNKDSFDKKKFKKKFNKALRRNYYYGSREYPYKYACPKIIAEKYEENKGTEFLPVYKFFCFSGEPYLIQTIQNDKQYNESIDYFDINWNKMDIRQNFPNSLISLNKPSNLETMIEIAKKLSAGLPFVRVDLYEVNGQVYFSEFTFYSDAGFEPFHPEHWDIDLGKKIILPEKVNEF